MENPSSRRQIAGTGRPRSPRLLQAPSTRTPEITPLSNSGRKSVDRSNSFRRTSISSSKGGEENRNPSTTITLIPGISKKPQDDHQNLIISNSVKELQRQRSPEVVKTIEKVKTKKKESASPSPWALSPGRPSSIFSLPESVDSSGGTAKQRSRSPSNILNYFKQKKTSSVQEEAFHQLRIMHTRLLQWRLVNARAQSTVTATMNFAEVAETGLLASELVSTVEQERKGLRDLRKEIVIVAALEEQQKSLRAHVIQAATDKERRVEETHLISSIKLMDACYKKDKAEKSIPQQSYRKGHFLRLYLSNVQNKDNYIKTES
ncbi:hypothetical protein NE237_028629 [Protea cynaroides]|uniref:Uncharacterized protein n=1 Tax=Protea cynaroides TaxID=273540 RepID=A0A9Q0JU96_9MAGN|nr:hypothetical protein NE237_028629 [Protea cynaroides]